MADLGSEQILLVDDNPTNLHVLFKTLEGSGYRLLAARDGEAALYTAKRARPSLILLDVMMPGMDGPQVLEKIQQLQEFCDTPVVFITAKAQIEEINKLKTLGAIDVITKPFNPMTLGDEIKTIWQRHYDKSKR